MARLVTTGFETGDVMETGLQPVIGVFNTTIGVASSTPTPRTGTYCLKSTFGGLGGSNASWKPFRLPSAVTDVWVRFAFLAHLTISPQAVELAAVDSSAGVNQSVLQYDNSGGLIKLYRDTGAGNTLLASSTSSIADGAWHLLEWRTQILTATTGVSELWLDGGRVINFSGDNSFSSTLDIQTVRLGQVTTVTGNASGSYLAYDDIAINDTTGSLNNGRIYDGRVVLLKPNGVGTSASQTRGGTDTGANWSQCSEIPASMTQYVYSVTPATRDLYALENVPAGNWGVNAVEVIALALNTQATAGSIGVTLKSGATTDEATAQAITTVASFVRKIYDADPNTSAAWTVAAVNALEAGTTVR